MCFANGYSQEMAQGSEAGDISMGFSWGPALCAALRWRSWACFC